MQTRELALVGKLDNGLAKGLCLLLRGLKTGSLWLIGLSMFASLPWMIFEYGEGLADLSPLEWMFIPLLALLLWRHVRYCQHFATGVWSGLSRLLIFQGVMGVFELAVIGFAAGLLAQKGHLEEFLHYLMQDDPISKCVTFGTVLLAVYLAVPTATTKTLLTPEEPPARVEPTLYATVKETSL